VLNWKQPAKFKNNQLKELGKIPGKTAMGKTIKLLFKKDSQGMETGRFFLFFQLE
jgi:hypothetical protein